MSCFVFQITGTTARTYSKGRWKWRMRQAVRFDPNTAKYMIFGGYAADCAKMDFSKALAAPTNALTARLAAAT